MIALSGVDGIDIKYVGLRDGEKLFEEVLNDKEATVPTHHPKIMVAKVREYPYELARKNEEELYQLSFTYDDMAVVKKMKEIVPEYKSQHSRDSHAVAVRMLGLSRSETIISFNAAIDRQLSLKDIQQVSDDEDEMTEE